MSAIPQAAIIPFPHVGRVAEFDRVRLLRMTCLFERVHQTRTQVLHDEDDAVTRYLCRAPRAVFEHREEFLAAAVKRFLGPIADRRLAEMIYVATLYQAGVHAPVSLPVLRARVVREFAVPVPALWLEQLTPPKTLEASLLNLDANTLEFVAGGPRWWTYGLVEG